MDDHRQASEPVPAQLSLWDAVSIILGIIIGAGIFETPAEIFRLSPNPAAALGVWVLGGILALLGAFCFAELASTYPRSGGEYVYLTRAFGPLVGYLFAWAQLTVIRTGSIGAVAYVFAKYADRIWDLGPHGPLILASSAIAILTVINILGVTLGTRTQNLLTVAKVLGLGLVIVAGLLWASPKPRVRPLQFGLFDWFAQAMTFVLWTYSGWHEAAYVATEVRNPRRNLPLSLIVSTAAVTVIYLAVNGALLIALGPGGAEVGEPAAEVLALGWGESGVNVMCLLVVISSLGAINGMIFTTARIYSAFGADHRLFQPLNKWSRRYGTPVRALVVQGVITLAMTVGVGLWFGGAAGFEALVYCTAAVFWLFFWLTGIALLVLRTKDRDVYRPFRVPGYPVVPILFSGWCAYMVVGQIQFKPFESVIGLIILLLGVPLFLLPQKGQQPPSVGQTTPTPDEPLRVG